MCGNSGWRNFRVSSTTNLGVEAPMEITPWRRIAQRCRKPACLMGRHGSSRSRRACGSGCGGDGRPWGHAGQASRWGMQRGPCPLAKGRAVYRAWLAGIYNAQFPLNGRHFPPGIPDTFREVSGIPCGRYSGVFPESIRNTIPPFPNAVRGSPGRFSSLSVAFCSLLNAAEPPHGWPGGGA